MILIIHNREPQNDYHLIMKINWDKQAVRYCNFISNSLDGTEKPVIP